VARHRTGIYGRPSGQVGRVVWSESRSPQGSISTTRERAVPLDPASEAQQSRRLLLSAAAAAIGHMHPPMIDPDWGQTPRAQPIYQRVISWIMRHTYAAGGTSHMVEHPSAERLGPVYQPGITVYGGGSGYLGYSYSTDLVGDYCSPQDLVRAFVIPQHDVGSPLPPAVLYRPGTDRSNGGGWVSGLQTGVRYTLTLWFRHELPSGRYAYSATASDSGYPG
jgi:hypothetical protein